jgi:hypothetical protein
MPATIAALRDSGLSWRAIESKLGVSVRTARRLASASGKRVLRTPPKWNQIQRQLRHILAWQWELFLPR